MRALRLLPLLALTGLILVAAPAAPAAPVASAAAKAGTETARIVDFDFAPRRLTVAAGTSVSWSNTGQRPHTATDRGGTFDTKPIDPGGSARVTFSVPGTYFYFCRINPAKMNGVVSVKAGADPARAVRVQAVDEGQTGDKLRFDPPELSVPAGTTVLVANVGGKPHTLTADDGSFDTGLIDPGAQGGRFAGRNASVTLDEAGTFRFHCEVHPAAMKGVVTVTGGAAAGAGTPAAAAAGPREIDVGAVDFAFQPKDASVAPGGKVTVTNRGQASHTLTLDDQPLDTGNIAPGASADLTAPDQPGSYSYRCTVHPARMRGVLVVLGRDTEDPTAQAAAPPPAAPAASGGGGGPGGGVTAFVLATAVVAAFVGGVGLSAFALRRRTA
jgi:plastocyanin